MGTRSLNLLSFLPILPSASPLAPSVFSGILGTCSLNTSGFSFLVVLLRTAPLPGPQHSITPGKRRTSASTHHLIFSTSTCGHQHFASPSYRYHHRWYSWRNTWRLTCGPTTLTHWPSSADGRASIGRWAGPGTYLCCCCTWSTCGWNQVPFRLLLLSAKCDAAILFTLVLVWYWAFRVMFVCLCAGR